MGRSVGAGASRGNTIRVVSQWRDHVEVSPLSATRLPHASRPQVEKERADRALAGPASQRIPEVRKVVRRIRNADAALKKMNDAQNVDQKQAR